MKIVSIRKLAAVILLTSPQMAGAGEAVGEDRSATRLDAEILAPIQHKTMGISPDEKHAYYLILNKAGIVDQSELRAVAASQLEGRRAELENFDDDAEFPLFADMFRNPEVYTGRPVTLTGHVRKVMNYPADPNEFGVEQLYELWLFPADSQSNPVVVVCTELPPGFPAESEIIDNVSVTGYFFKVYGYKAQDATRGAPLILAHRPSWRSTHIQTGFGVRPLTVALVVTALVGGLVWMAWYTHRKDRETSRRRLMEPPPELVDQPPYENEENGQ